MNPRPSPSRTLSLKPFFPALFFLIPYVGLSLLAFAPGLLLGHAYFANDLLEYFGPARSFLRNQLLQGHFPLWNPYLYGGQPFFANPNSMMCYPLNYLTLLFPIPYGLTVFFAVHMALSGLGMRFWLRTLGLGERAALVGSFLFASSGYFWFHLPQPNLLAVHAWFPWFMGCLELYIRNWNKKWAFLTGLCFAMVFCCGIFQMTTCVFYTGLAYFFFFTLIGSGQKDRQAPKHTRFRKTGILLLFALWGALPLLVQLIPAHEFYLHSIRSDPRLNYDNFYGTFSMAPRSTSQFLFPFLGVPPGTTLEKAIQVFDHPHDKDNDFAGVYGYLGVWAPFLMALAFGDRDKKRVWVLAVLGLTSLLSAWGHYFPLHRLECAALPGIGLSRAPYRLIETYVLLMSALCAYGFQSLELKLAGSKIPRSLLWGTGLYVFFLSVIAFTHPDRTWREISGLILGAGALSIWSFTSKRQGLGRRLFIFSVFFPLLLAGWAGFSRGPSSNYDLERNFPALRHLSQEGPGRRYLFDKDLPLPVQSGGVTYERTLSKNAPLSLGVRSLSGGDGIFLEKSFDLTRLPPRLYIGLMALGGQVLKDPIGEIKGVAHLSFPGCELYEPLVPEPFVRSPDLIQVVPSDREALERMEQIGFDPSSQLVLTSPSPPPLGNDPSRKKAALAYAWEKDEPDDQIFRVRLNNDSWLLFSEIMYPGWKAWIDGKKAPLFTGDYTFRTLFTPTGIHKVEFRFEPAWALPLSVGLLFWLLSVLVFGRLKGWTSPPKPRKMGHA